MGIIDCVILLLIIIFMIIGFTRGFLKQVLSTVAWIIALITAITLCSAVSDLLFTSNIGQSLNDVIYGWISEKGDVFTTVYPTMTEDNLILILSEMKIPSFLHNLLIGMVDITEFKNCSIAQFISPEITSVLITIVSFVLIYLVVFIIVKVISSICSHIVKGSALGFLDGTLGAIWGAVKICILISILMLGLSFIVTMPFGESINEWITMDMRLNDDTFGIGKFFYENNPILYIISELPFNK